MKRLARFAAVLGIALWASAAAALQVTPLGEALVSVHLTARGESRAEAELQAKREAVMAATGRVLLDNKLFRAEELLQRYLTNYAPKFVSGVEVLRDEFAGGYTQLECRVFVDYAALVADLEEKRFLYTPAYKPQFAIFMEERLEGSRTEVEVARRLLQTALQVEGMKAYAGRIDSPPVSVDLSVDSTLMQTGLVTAERRNVEIIVTGQTNTYLREQRKLYYDNFYFYECEMQISAVRVDTGHVFFTTEARDAGSAKDQADAVRVAIERTAAAIAREVEQSYSEFWPAVVQAKSEYEVLLTATDDELTRITSEYLKRLGDDTVVSTRRSFGSSAVLTINTPANRDAILDVLRSSPYPVLHIIREVGNRKFEVQVSG